MLTKLTYAFRITHIANIPYIEKVGLVRADSPLRDPAYVSIGDKKVIEVRSNRIAQGHRLKDYIPFYLGPRSPMLYVIQHGYNGVQRVNAEDIVYCVVRLADLQQSDIDLVFTDGHALSVLSSYFEKKDLPRIDSLVKVQDVYSSQWNLEEDLDLKRRKEAELLVKGDLAIDYIKGYVVYNDEAKKRLIAMGVPREKVAVRPGYYF